MRSEAEPRSGRRTASSGPATWGRTPPPPSLEEAQAQVDELFEVSRERRWADQRVRALRAVLFTSPSAHLKPLAKSVLERMDELPPRYWNLADAIIERYAVYAEKISHLRWLQQRPSELKSEFDELYGRYEAGGKKNPQALIRFLDEVRHPPWVDTYPEIEADARKLADTLAARVAGGRVSAAHLIGRPYDDPPALKSISEAFQDFREGRIPPEQLTQQLVLAFDSLRRDPGEPGMLGSSFFPAQKDTPAATAAAETIGNLLQLSRTRGDLMVRAAEHIYGLIPHADADKWQDVLKAQEPIWDAAEKAIARHAGGLVPRPPGAAAVPCPHQP